MVTKKHVFCLCVIVCCVLTGSAAFANDPNLPNYTPTGEQGYSEMEGGISLGFDPDDYDFLVYDCSSGEIQGAMDVLGLSYTLRNKSNPVTSQDLIDYDILIVGWKAGSADDTDGLDPAVIEQGITGRVILTGHDTDWHTVNDSGNDQWAAETFLSQSIGYILEGSGTGLLAHGEYVVGYDWLPESWGIEVTDGLALEDVTAFTQDGIDSGIFDDLTPEDMSDWENSFHNTFTDWGDGFVSFELGKVNDVDSVITIAATVNPYGFPFGKEDDVDESDCRSPEEEITYTICWENSTDQTFTEAWIIDYLPSGVYYPGAYWRLDPNMALIPPDPAYDPNTHSYAWEIGTVAPNDANCVTLTVTVNYKAEPGMYLHNVAEIWAGDTLLTKATEDTPVCCWDTTDPNIIFVDKNSRGNNNGTSWGDAYTDLQDGLERARESICFDRFIICVAQGTYKPNNTPDESFVLPDNCQMYGGFRSGGSDFGERNPKKYRTILAGQIDEQRRADTVVTMGDETLLDGFTVTGAATFGKNIYGSGVDFTIENCTVEKSEGYGIRSTNGDITIKWCEIRNNELDGIRHQGNGFTLTVENTQIRQNMRYGVRSQNSTPTIKNSVVSENDLAKEGRQGIRLITPTYSPVLHNNTIAHNKAAGISFVDNSTINDPNDKDWPDVQNCILWYNNMAAETPVQFAGFRKDRIYYSCIYDPNSDDLNLDDNDNFSANPKFAYHDPNNVHLAYDSPCKDRGNPDLSYDDQVDMDSEDRKVGEDVDVGADELYSCDEYYSEDDFYNALDWNADGVVNMYEFSEFSSAWLSHDPNDPAWISDPNLVDPGDSAAWSVKCNLDDTGNSEYVIDLADLVVFASETPWLWEACWRDNYIEMYGMMRGGGESMFGLGGGQEMMESTPAGFEDEEQSVYANMSKQELALFVKGIYELIEQLEIWIEEDLEDTGSAMEIIDHLEAMLVEIQESRQ